METVHLEGTFPSLKSVDVESASFVDLSRGSFPSVATLYLVNWAAATYIFDLADLPDLEAFYVMPAEFEGPSGREPLPPGLWGRRSTTRMGPRQGRRLSSGMGQSCRSPPAHGRLAGPW